MILRPRINKIRRWGGGKGIITGYALQESPVLILDGWECLVGISYLYETVQNVQNSVYDIISLS